MQHRPYGSLSIHSCSIKHFSTVMFSNDGYKHCYNCLFYCNHNRNYSQFCVHGVPYEAKSSYFSHELCTRHRNGCQNVKHFNTITCISFVARFCTGISFCTLFCAYFFIIRFCVRYNNHHDTHIRDNILSLLTRTQNYFCKFSTWNSCKRKSIT